MAKLKITKTDGTSGFYPVTPIIEYAFEQYKGKGFHKAFREEEKQSDLFWLAMECVRRSGETVPVLLEKFIETLAEVEVLDDDPLA